jgi:ectoine hydroxylase-related dioxygenase (phytanoyl-CoA dioxygenase family)
MAGCEGVDADTTGPLDEAQVAAYWRDGAICVRGAFDAEWIEALREGAEKVRAAHGRFFDAVLDEPDGRNFFVDVHNWPRIAEFERGIKYSPAVAIAAQITRAERLCALWDAVFYRTAGTAHPTPWHQDVPYWPVEGDSVCSFWLPLDPAPEDCVLGFLRASHRVGRFKRPSFADDDPGTQFAADHEAAGEVPDIDADPAAHDILRWPLEPGDCIVFHGYTLHGHPSNPRGERPFRSLALRYAGDDVTYVERPEGTNPDYSGDSHGLPSGDPVESALFPLVWRREGPVA